MLPIYPGTEFPKYLENEGYSCPICLEPFTLTDTAHEPTRLGKCIHALCIPCFKQFNSNSCPVCRDPVVASSQDGPQGFPDKVEEIRALWIKFVANPKAATPSDLSTSAPTPAAATSSTTQTPQCPESFETLNAKIQSLAGVQKELEAFDTQMKKAVHLALPAMKWELVSPDLNKALKEHADNLVLFSKTAESSPFGFAILLGQDPVCDVRWAGVTRNPTENDGYENLLRLIVAAFMSKPRDSVWCNRENVKITFEFDFKVPADTSLYQTICGIIISKFGTQMEIPPKTNDNKIKVSFYPFVPLYMPNATRVPSAGITTTFRRDLKDKFQKSFDELNRMHQVVILFEMASASERDFNQLCESFKSDPGTFFFYTVDGKARGFIRAVCSTNMERNSGFVREPLPTDNKHLTLIKHFIAPDMSAFKQEFIAQFLQRLKAQDSISLEYLTTQRDPEFATKLKEAAEKLNLKVSKTPVFGMIRTSITF